MDKISRNLLLVAHAFYGIVLAITVPSVNVYFMSHVSTQIVALSNMITVGLAAIVSTSATFDRARLFYKRIFELTVVTFVILYAVIAFLSIEDVTVRFLGMAVLQSCVASLWTLNMDDCINHVLSGADLTKFKMLKKSIGLYAALFGGAVAVYIGTIDITIGLALQCVSVLIDGVVEVTVFLRLGGRNHD